MISHSLKINYTSIKRPSCAVLSLHWFSWYFLFSFHWPKVMKNEHFTLKKEVLPQTFPEEFCTIVRIHRKQNHWDQRFFFILFYFKEPAVLPWFWNRLNNRTHSSLCEFKYPPQDWFSPPGHIWWNPFPCTWIPYPTLSNRPFFNS
jgi:hypothetical protein